jgi:hypothetical protein
MIHAMRKLTSPIVTVNTNMASRLLYSIDTTVSRLCKKKLDKFLAAQLFHEFKAGGYTYTSHENQTTGHEAESCDEL